MFPDKINQDIQELLKRELKDFELPKEYEEEQSKMKDASTSTDINKQVNPTVEQEEKTIKIKIEEPKIGDNKKAEMDAILDNNINQMEGIEIKEETNQLDELDQLFGKDIQGLKVDSTSDSNNLKKLSYTEMELAHLNKTKVDRNIKAKKLAGLIEELILSYNIERYKYIVQVNLFLNQGIGTIMDSAMFWDTEKDKMVKETYKTDDFTCSVVVFSLYYN